MAAGQGSGALACPHPVMGPMCYSHVLQAVQGHVYQPRMSLRDSSAGSATTLMPCSCRAFVPAAVYSDAKGPSEVTHLW